jgi:hypothetical protein
MHLEEPGAFLRGRRRARRSGADSQEIPDMPPYPGLALRLLLVMPRAYRTRRIDLK